MTQRLVPLPGSHRPPPTGAKAAGVPSTRARIHVSIYARRNPKAERRAAALPDRLGAQLPQARTYLTDEQFAAVYGADPADLDQISAWIARCGLTIVACSAPHRRVIAEGPIAAVERAFAVKLRYYKPSGAGRYLGRVGNVCVPPDLVAIVQAVFGLDRRHVGSSRRRTNSRQTIAVGGRKRTASDLQDRWPHLFFPPRIAALYDFPPTQTGRGQHIAVLAFNGAQNGDPHGGYRRTALRAYFERVLRVPMPDVTEVVVQGPGNRPGADTTASANRGDVTSEVMLDLCVVGSLAPRAKIFVYFTEFTTQGWIDALNNIVAGHREISVVSISYGNPEHDPQGAWTPMGVRLVNEIFQAAAAGGMTICCAAGDDGSRDQESAGAHVDFPASSPYALGVGGTTLHVSAGATPVLTETVWNELRRKKGATGGGVSFVFPRPAYQRGVRLPHPAELPRLNGRGVPDVAAVADPLTGVIVMHVSGRKLVPMGGTSAAAPVWAGLVARINEALRARCGFLNPVLYRLRAHNILRDISVGSNGAFMANHGWDACTGLGAPGGRQLLAALRSPGRRAGKGRRS